MLIMYRINNYMSFQNDAVLDLRKTSYREHLEHIVKKIVDSILEYAIRKNMKISVETNVKEAVVRVDVDMLERCLLNLISNAIKFSGEFEMVRSSLKL